MGQAAKWELILLDCLHPNGLWYTYNILAGESPSAAPGVKTLRFKPSYLQIRKTVMVGEVFIRVKDDAGNVIYFKQAAVDPGGILSNDVGVAFNMPDRNYLLIFEAGHINTVTDTKSTAITKITKEEEEERKDEKEIIRILIATVTAVLLLMLLMNTMQSLVQTSK